MWLFGNKHTRRDQEEEGWAWVMDAAPQLSAQGIDAPSHEPISSHALHMLPHKLSHKPPPLTRPTLLLAFEDALQQRLRLCPPTKRRLALALLQHLQKGSRARWFVPSFSTGPYIVPAQHSWHDIVQHRSPSSAHKQRHPKGSTLARPSPKALASA